LTARARRQARAAKRRHRTAADAASGRCDDLLVSVRRRIAIVAALLALGAAGAAIATAAARYPFGRGTGGCRVFPASSPWHEKIAKLPVSPLSTAYIAA